MNGEAPDAVGPSRATLVNSSGETKEPLIEVFLDSSRLC